MALTLLRRPSCLTSLTRFHLVSRVCYFCSKLPALTDTTNSTGTKASAPNYSSNIHLSPLFSNGAPSSNGYNIELVDNDTWQFISGLAHVWHGISHREIITEANSATEAAFDEQANGIVCLEGDSDFDEIDNMRIRGNLFYKLDRNSKEFEEYSFDFHRRKSSKKNGNHKEAKNKENPKAEKLPKIVKNGKVYSLQLDDDMNASCGAEKKKVRTPTFNQLTGPYHEPFCLDIYISKASVRACVIHRVTSKVVAVAHSISKDLKFDLSSTRNAAACAAVGAVLAQRALADDIHDVVYTPRKGERLEGKLQIVLQSIIDNGINVKVKVKQRQHKKGKPPKSA